MRGRWGINKHIEMEATLSLESVVKREPNKCYGKRLVIPMVCPSIWFFSLFFLFLTSLFPSPLSLLSLPLLHASQSYLVLPENTNKMLFAITVQPTFKYFKNGPLPVTAVNVQKYLLVICIVFELFLDNSGVKSELTS